MNTADATGGRFAERTVLVTGGSRGIGREIARQFANEGANVAVIARSKQQLASTVEEFVALPAKAIGVVADVRDAVVVRAAVQQVESTFGPIDVLVNNAGGSDDPTHFLDITEDDWDSVMDTNLKGAFLVGQAAARSMAAADGGVIINIASVDAFGAERHYASYGAAKAGLVGLTRSMALDLAEQRIRVNSVSPGYTESDWFRSIADASLVDMRRFPMGRLVHPREIAAACLFLASGDASAITGTNLTVDVGLMANLYVLETLGNAADGIDADTDVHR